MYDNVKLGQVHDMVHLTTQKQLITTEIYQLNLQTTCNRSTKIPYRKQHRAEKCQQFSIIPS